MTAMLSARTAVTLERLRRQLCTDRVPAGEAAEHVLRLVADGMSPSAVARSADVPDFVVRQIVAGTAVTLSAAYAEALLEVELIPRRIDATDVVEWIRRHTAICGGVHGVLSESDVRWFWRSARDGHCCPWKADEVLNRYWRVSLNHVVGPDWDRRGWTAAA